MRALVAAAYGRQFELWQDGDSTCVTQAVTRGKKTEVSVGDWVNFNHTSKAADQSVIEAIEPRRNEVKRSDAFRTKWLAANIDIAVLVVAIDPPFSDEVTTRVRCAMQVANVPLLLVLNKMDRLEHMQAHEQLRLSRQIADLKSSHVDMIEVSAKLDPEDLKAQLATRLENKTVLLLGQSGMGKSTLLNALVPNASARTQEISTVLSSGKHTTTHSKMYCVLKDDAGFEALLIDSPGFQAFGLGHLSISQLNHSMPEFEPYLGECRFNNCRHFDEPGCAITLAVSNGAISRSRYNAFKTIASDIAFIDQANLRS